MKIYLDMDDVLCETARKLCGLVFDLFGKGCAYDEMELFDLQRAYALTADENRILMENAHGREFLTSLEPVEGAADAVRRMVEAGCEITIVTGRPVSTAPYSLEWLEAHNFPKLPLKCLDKYNRWSMGEMTSEHFLSKDEFDRLHFDLFVDDSPAAIKMLSERDDGDILIFDRPWNRKTLPSRQRTSRVKNWKEIENFGALKCKLQKPAN